MLFLEDGGGYVQRANVTRVEGVRNGKHMGRALGHIERTVGGQ